MGRGGNQGPGSTLNGGVLAPTYPELGDQDVRDAPKHRHEVKDIPGVAEVVLGMGKGRRTRGRSRQEQPRPMEPVTPLHCTHGSHRYPASAPWIPQVLMHQTHGSPFHAPAGFHGSRCSPSAPMGTYQDTEGHDLQETLEGEEGREDVVEHLQHVLVGIRCVIELRGDPGMGWIQGDRDGSRGQ